MDFWDMDLMVYGSVASALAYILRKPADTVGKILALPIENFYDSLNEEFKKRKITQETLQKALHNTDTSTMFLEVIDKVKTKTDEYIQDLFAKIMADEIENEGSFSLETIHRLAQLTKKDLLFFFNEVAPFCFKDILFNRSLEKNMNFIDLDIINDGRFKTLTITNHTPNTQILTITMSNNCKIRFKKEDFNKISKHNRLLNRFGRELLKLQEIRKWTEEDKEVLRNHFAEVGIKKEDIIFTIQ